MIDREPRHGRMTVPHAFERPHVTHHDGDARGDARDLRLEIGSQFLNMPPGLIAGPADRT